MAKGGEVWFDDFTFEEVDAKIEITGRVKEKSPSNSSFED